MFEDQELIGTVPRMILVGFTAAPWLGNNNVSRYLWYLPSFTLYIPYPAGIGRKVKTWTKVDNVVEKDLPSLSRSGQGRRL